MSNPNNNITIIGRIVDEPVKSFRTTQGEWFYQITVATERLSGVKDNVPVLFSQAKLPLVNDIIASGEKIEVHGEIRSCSKPRNDGSDKMKLIVSVFSKSISQYTTQGDEDKDVNEAILCGSITRMGELRTTPSGMTIVDFTVGVNGLSRVYKVPCICWGRTAEWVSTIEGDSPITLFGRFQSRVYKNQKGEVHTVYELSVNDLRFGEDEQ